MKLQEWFKVKTSRPLGMILIILLLLWISFAIFEFQTQSKQIKNSLSDFDKQISLAIAQNNRPFLEFIVENAFHQFDAKAIALCVDGRMDIEINAKYDLCIEKEWFGILKQDIRGFHDISLVIKSDLLNRIFKYFPALFLILALSTLVIKLLSNLKKNIYEDFIVPLGHLLSEDHKFQIDEVQEIRIKLKEAIAAEKEIARAKATLMLSKQVAHDIRSPLSALTMVTGTLKDLPEEKRILLRNATQRINDIANDLLQKGQKMENGHTAENGCEKIKLTTEFLPALIDVLVSEKRTQYRAHAGIDIDVNLKNSFGAFANINSTELKRILSNLINNSVEAFDKNEGKITVGVKKTNQQASKVEIFVNDNGKGIPAHILDKLGQVGITSGKQGTASGSGLGIYHTKKTVESFGGQLQIESLENQGTTITIVLPLAEAPQWFANKIELTNKNYLVSLDDDISIHQIWSGRLQSLGYNEIEHIKLQSGDAFEKYVSANISKLRQTVFLIDYELLNQPKTGLDIIEEMGLEKYSILVTSRYEEPAIQARASRLKLPLLPKSLSGFVPIDRAHSKKYDWVLIDDDDLVHLSWRMAAQASQKTFIGFKSPEDFNTQKILIDPDSTIYIDSSLGNATKGEDFAKRLYTEGFNNLYLATGYDPETFPPMKFLKGIVGKEPPLHISK